MARDVVGLPQLSGLTPLRTPGELRPVVRAMKERITLTGPGVWVWCDQAQNMVLNERWHAVFQCDWGERREGISFGATADLMEEAICKAAWLPAVRKTVRRVTLLPVKSQLGKVCPIDF